MGDRLDPRLPDRPWRLPAPARRRSRSVRAAGRPRGGERAARLRLHRPGALPGPASDRLGEGFGPLGGVVGSGMGALLAAEAGAISGFLAGRVLGQYEFPILDPDAPARLLFVAPNLGQAAGALEAEPDQLLRWVALHETTHALQFGAVPWLREHLAACVRELLGAMSFQGGSLLKIPDMADLKALVESVREGGIATLALGPER